MGITIAPTIPATSASNGSGTCQDCGHQREGIAVTLGTNRCLLRKARPLVAPSCSSGFDMGFGDEDMCGCMNACHSERLTTETRYLT